MMVGRVLRVLVRLLAVARCAEPWTADPNDLTCEVAVVFTGHLRTFTTSEGVRRSIRQNLVEALRDGGRCAVDVFGLVTPGAVGSAADAEGLAAFEALLSPVVLRSTECAPPGSLSGLPGLSAAEEASEVAYLRGLYGPVPGQRRWDQRWWGVESARQQYANVARGFELARDFEGRRLQSRGAYDWVVRARFDAAWARPLPPLLSFVPDRVWVKDTPNGVNDQFALVPRHLAGRFFGAWEWLFGARSNGTAPWWAPRLKWQPESMLWRHLRAHGVSFGRFSAPFVLVRADAGPQCARLRAWPLPLQFLELVAGGARGPSGMSLAEGLRRAQFASCARSLAAAPPIVLEGRYSASASAFDWGRSLELAQEDEGGGGGGGRSDLKTLPLTLPTAHDPAANARALEEFCAAHGLEPSCDLLAERLWRDGVPLPPPRDDTHQDEVAWVVGGLLGLLTTLHESTGASVSGAAGASGAAGNGADDGAGEYVFEVVAPTREDPDEARLHPPAVQRVALSSGEVESLVRTAACAYLFWLGLQVNSDASPGLFPTDGGGGGGGSSRDGGYIDGEGGGIVVDGVGDAATATGPAAAVWPAHSAHGAACVAELSRLEQRAALGLDAHLTTRATWAGEHGGIFSVRLAAVEKGL